MVEKLCKSGTMASDKWERLLAPESNSLFLRLTQKACYINFPVDDVVFDRLLSACHQKDVLKQCMDDIKCPVKVSEYEPPLIEIISTCGSSCHKREPQVGQKAHWNCRPLSVLRDQKLGWPCVTLNCCRETSKEIQKAEADCF